MAKQKRLKPRLVKGFRDVMGQSVVDRERMISQIRGVYDLYGFIPLETPLIEYLDVLGKHLRIPIPLKKACFPFAIPMTRSGSRFATT